LWARALTVAAGPVFNFILSILIFAAFALWIGTATESNVVGALKPHPFAGDTLLVGDEITAVNGMPTVDLAAFAEVSDKIAPVAEVTYTILRNGQSRDVKGPHPAPPIADDVQGLTAAFDAGLQGGDVIQSVNGTPIYTFNQLREITGKSNGEPLNLKIWRDGAVLDIMLVPRMTDVPSDEGFESRWLIGLNGSMLFEPETRQTGIVESIRFGVRQLGAIVSGTFSGLAHIVRGDISTCNLKGPIGIAKTSGAAASLGVDNFILVIGLLSASVGLMNLFPIPVLDGGHLVFHAWEAVTRRPPPERIMRMAMTVGFAAIMGLMAFALSRDLFC
jgi:regulator of sigma E protease